MNTRDPRRFSGPLTSLVTAMLIMASVTATSAPITLDATDRLADSIDTSGSGEDMRAGSQALAAGDAVTAQAAFMRALSRRPDDVLALLGMASSMQLKGDRLDALNWTLRALSYRPTDPKVLEAHEQLSAENDDVPAAVERVEAIVAAHPEAAAPKQALARLLMLDRRPDDAIAVLRAMIDGGSPDPLLRLDLGRAQLLSGQPQAAADTLNGLRKTMPGAPQVLLPLVRAELALGHPDIALAHLATMESGGAVTPAMMMLKGESLEALDRPVDAAQAYARAAQSGSDPIALAKQAQALSRAGQPRAALTIYEQILAQAPDNLVALNNAAYLSSSLHEALDTALARAQRALKIGGDKAALYDTLAAVYLARGETAKARQALERALSLDPAHVSAQGRLAAVQAGQAAPGVSEKLASAPAQTVLEAPPVVAAPEPEPVPSPEPAPDTIAAVAAAPATVEAAPAPATTPAAVPIERAPTVVASASQEAPASLQAMLSDALERWRLAWEGERYDDYVAAYVSTASPIDGLSRKQWEQDRKRKLSKPGRLEITVESVEWTRVDDTTWTSRFVQHYASSNYRDKSLKTLTWSREDGQWRIAREVAKTL